MTRNCKCGKKLGFFSDSTRCSYSGCEIIECGECSGKDNSQLKECDLCNSYFCEPHHDAVEHECGNLEECQYKDCEADNRDSELEECEYCTTSFCEKHLGSKEHECEDAPVCTKKKCEKEGDEISDCDDCYDPYCEEHMHNHGCEIEEDETDEAAVKFFGDKKQIAIIEGWNVSYEDITKELIHLENLGYEFKTILHSDDEGQEDWVFRLKEVTQ